MSEWKREFQAGKAARINGEMLFHSASSAWQIGWRQQDDVMRLRAARQVREEPRKVVFAPSAPQPPVLARDDALMKRRMMGGGRFVR